MTTGATERLFQPTLTEQLDDTESVVAHVLDRRRAIGADQGETIAANPVKYCVYPGRVRGILHGLPGEELANRIRGGKRLS